MNAKFGLRKAFLVRFVLTLVLLNAAINAGGFVDDLRLAYCRLLAHSCSFAIGLGGFAVSSINDSVFYDQRAFAVIPGCDGLELVTIFIAAAVSLPVWSAPTYRRAAASALVAIAALVGLNWLRVWTLAAVALFAPDLYDAMHGTVLQGVVILGTVAMVIVWVTWSSRGEVGFARAG